MRALDKQIAEKQATLQRLRMSIAFQTALIDTLTERVATRQQAIDLKVGTKINLYDAKEELQRSQSSLASDQGQLIETDAAIGELQSEKTKALSQFIADNENKAEDASRKADEARQSLAKASARLSHAKLYAPIDGIVQQLSATTFDQVVSAGQQLATVVPTDGALQVEALVANMDIGFVRVGQPVAVKLDAFPFTRFGALNGKVVAIAREAVDEQQAKRALANATAPGNSPDNPAAEGQTPSFVFPVTVAIDRYRYARRRRNHSACPWHDRNRRHQDRKSARDRLLAIAAQQDDFGIDDRKVAGLLRFRALRRRRRCQGESLDEPPRSVRTHSSGPRWRSMRA